MDRRQRNQDIEICARPFCEARIAWAFCTSGRAVGVCSWHGLAYWIRRQYRASPSPVIAENGAVMNEA